VFAIFKNCFRKRYEKLVCTGNTKKKAVKLGGDEK